MTYITKIKRIEELYKYTDGNGLHMSIRDLFDTGGVYCIYLVVSNNIIRRYTTRYSNDSPEYFDFIEGYLHINSEKQPDLTKTVSITCNKDDNISVSILANEV